MKIYKVISIIVFVVLFLCSPFIYSILDHEVRLFYFSRQLENVEAVLGKYADLIASGRQIYVGGNDEECSYRATRVYRDWGADADHLKDEIAKIKFRPVHQNKFHDNAEAYVLIMDSTVVITISDGPYSPGFDYRCF